MIKKSLNWIPWRRYFIKEILFIYLFNIKGKHTVGVTYNKNRSGATPSQLHQLEVTVTHKHKPSHQKS